MKQPTVTIGFLPRERFSLSAKALKKIYQHTHIPFNLVVVDCNMPSKYWKQIDNVLKGHSNVKIIRTDTFLQPNQSRNLILANTTDDYVCFIESDCMVSDNWLSRMIAACEEYPASVAIPLLLEGPTWRQKVHHDRRLGKIRAWKEHGKIAYEFIKDPSIKKRNRAKKCQRVWTLEPHIMLFQRKVFDKIGLFDEKLSAREPVDLSLALYKAKIPIVFEPRARVNFYNPPPVHKEEIPFYRFIWDIKRGIKSNMYLKKKWNLYRMPYSVRFIKGQHYRTSFLRWQLYCFRKMLSKIKTFSLSNG